MIQLVFVLAIAVIGFIAFTRMKAMKGSAGGSYADARAQLTSQFNAIRQPGESDAVFVGMGTHKLAKNRQFYVAVTNQRVLLNELASTELRAFDRRAVGLSATRTKWIDEGNMTRTETHGYDVTIKLPDGETHVLRLYGENPYDTAHAPALGSFLRNVNG